MTTLREAAQQALEAMEKATRFMSDSDYRKLNESIDALKAALVEDAMQKFTDVNQELEAALAEPVQEPQVVAVIGNWGRVEWVDGVFPQLGDKMYSAPPQRKPLSGEQLRQIELGLRIYYDNGKYDLSLHDFARAIERAHGIGEQP